ncbi:hypothetical protein EN45_049290 [Penicillium chrysogenum]|uniref:Pc20g13990 protein n=2 Tax=Penicillium chrysogenum species complex TaxID=254878 RepID=B6HH36_PENRW|nr:uncharacterized protein N7525_009774 [Penicillium rubens]KAJ5053151.1 hypothetical protein NUH16_010211 [Penicillium rubens]KAJ5831521.1 hypothetical protein N7525_009774 [Penicillium rubens]KZN86407.1 hypothetical protein EN45_049290 [Penicillium chrysogenum]CAP86728.1 Pc20g13990 [Penicillium rubens Wisconsin 54-1255]
MRPVNLAAFACAVIGASAFEFPDFVPLHKRQEPGTPAYECHANCGGVITAGRSDGYCDTDDFKTELADCLKCAVEFDIWKYYGGSVSKAANACGLDATPVEASSTTTSVSATTTSDAASATQTAEESINSAVTTDTAASSTGTTVVTTSVSPPHVSSSARLSSLIPSATPTGSSTASTPSSSPVYNGGSTISSGNGLVFSAFAGCLIAAFM